MLVAQFVEETVHVLVQQKRTATDGATGSVSDEEHLRAYARVCMHVLGASVPIGTRRVPLAFPLASRTRHAPLTFPLARVRVLDAHLPAISAQKTAYCNETVMQVLLYEYSCAC